MEKIKIGICGYGNLGKGVEKEISKVNDMELKAIFTKRNPEKIQKLSKVNVIQYSKIFEFKDDIEVMIMCGGSATDLPNQVPKIAKYYNTVDSFDTHAKIPEYYENVNKSAIQENKTCTICGGWDPGLFSIIRLYGESFLPQGNSHTFWGKGVSQGHSNAIRSINGVKDGIQYTIPNEEMIKKIRSGKIINISEKEKHIRQCFVVAEDGANRKEIENKIKKMPNYFEGYKTEVNFISEEEMKEKHNKLFHGGLVIREGKTGDENNHIMEYQLKLDSNPEFTASILIALARATYRLNRLGVYGAKTILEIPPFLLSEKCIQELRKTLL